MTPPPPTDEPTTLPPNIKPVGPRTSPQPEAPNSSKSPSDVHDVPPKAQAPVAPPRKSALDHSTAAAAVDVVHWTSLFDGKSMGDWKVSGFGTDGKIEVKDGQLIIGAGEGCSGVTWKGAFPKTDYEISLEAKRVDGSDFFCGLTFPVGNDPCSFIVGGWGGSVVGLSSINGDDASENSTGTSMKFDDDRWYTIRVRVNKARIVCWIDKAQLVDEPLDGVKISIRSEVEASKPLGIATWHTTGAIRDIRWRPLTEAERK